MPLHSLVSRASRRPVLLMLFALSLSLSLLSPALPSFPQTYTPEQQALIEEIQIDAQRAVENGRPPLELDNIEVLYFQEAEQVGLSLRDIFRVYEEAYNEATAAQPPENPWDVFRPEVGWVLAGIFFMLAIFRDAAKKWIGLAVEKTGNWFYQRLAGNPLALNWALGKYRDALKAKHKQLKIPFRPNRPLEMREVFVPLQVSGSAVGEQIDAYQAVAQYKRLMVTGKPGSGKSMLLKSLALAYAEERLAELTDRPTMVLLELHRLRDPKLTRETLIQEIVNAFDRDNFPKAQQFVENSLKKGRLMLLLDGLDEVNSSVRGQVVRCLQDLLDRYDQCRAIITCRTAVYGGEFAEVVNKTLEVVEFSDPQMQQFLQAWKSQMPAGKSVEQLLQTLRDRPRIMALARNPLMLTIIAYLYTDTPFVLPHSRAEFYQKATDILLEQWDQARQRPNTYKGNEKRIVLQRLAHYNQTTANQQHQDRRTISYTEVLEQVKAVLPGLNRDPEKDVSLIFQELLERSGLLVAVGKGQGYQFAHLTLQEFFTASELLAQPNELLQQFAADPDAWRETAKLWCGLASDSTEFIRRLRTTDALVAFEALADAQSVDQALADDLIAEFEQKLGTAQPSLLIEEAFGAVAADTRPRGQAVFAFLETMLKQGKREQRQAAANALSHTNLSKAAIALADTHQNPETFTLSTRPLIRLGDLAVPQLIGLADQGGREAFELLGQIATPDAADALVPFLWKDGQCVEIVPPRRTTPTSPLKPPEAMATIAAWELAFLIKKPDIQQRLQEYSFPDIPANEQWSWIWEPFEPNPKSSLRAIAGHIAQQLSQRIPESKRIQIVITASNIFPRKNEFPTEQLLLPLCAIQTSNVLSQKALQTYGRDFAGLMEQSQNDILQDKKVSLLERVINDDAVIKGSPDQVEQGRNLFQNLEPSLQFELLVRLMESRMPDRNDWRNLYRRVQYRFQRSWHYGLVLGVAFLASLAALGQMIWLPINFPLNWQSWLGIVPAFVLISFWQFQWFGIETRLESRNFQYFGIWGIRTFAIELLKLFRQHTVWQGVDRFYQSQNSSPNRHTLKDIFNEYLFMGIVLCTSAVFANVFAYGLLGSGPFDNQIEAPPLHRGEGTPPSVDSGAAGTADLADALVAPIATVLISVGVFAFVCAGIAFWVRAKEHDDIGKYFAVLAFPFFCWLPFTMGYASFALRHWLPWSGVGLVWLVVFGVGSACWVYGTRKERRAQNPLQGLLPESYNPSR